MLVKSTPAGINFTYTLNWAKFHKARPFNKYTTSTIIFYSQAFWSNLYKGEIGLIQKLEKKSEGFILLGSVVLLSYINMRIIWLRNVNKLKNFFKFNSNSSSLDLSNENPAIIDWTTLIWALISIVIFFGINYKVNSTKVEELNLYPNYLLVYCLQLIAFQLFSFLVLSLLYSRQKEMLLTLFNALKGQY